MNKTIFGIVAVAATFMLAEALTCNNCNFGLMGFCLTPRSTVCTTNTSTCFTGKAAFPSLPSFSGFNSQGCMENALCTNSTSGTILGATYTITTTCCNTTLCNPVTTSGAASVKLTVTTVIGAAMVASMWGCML
ncbi:sperm acrosome membrane-associated protein 4 [Esox lucius]|uniref:UPAR/Ly6 domain-containing protein n=1 Tax=Esox lucius TaxID=8010 RepID=A0AAY5KHD5_ESOLU|nr:sperm acrosome membrane-associated protein 4 [Esox lucius]